MRLLSVAPLLFLLAGCEHDTGLRIVLDARGGLVGEVDELRVEVVANQSEDPAEPYNCTAASRTFPGVGEARLELPVVLVVRPGELPWRSVAVAVEAWGSGAALFRTEELFLTDLSRVEERTLWLDGACMAEPGTPLCEESEVCVTDGAGVRCASSSLEELLDRALLGASCDEDP